LLNKGKSSFVFLLQFHCTFQELLLLQLKLEHHSFFSFR